MNQFNMEDLQKNLGNGNFQDGFDLSGAKFDLQTTVERLVIEDILVINAGRKNKITVPDGYEKIDGDLNEGAGGRYIYLCKRRGKEGAIHDVRVISAKNANPPAPEGYTMIPQDLNEKAGGRYIYLCYC